jgi:hypothetical protein
LRKLQNSIISRRELYAKMTQIELETGDLTLLRCSQASFLSSDRRIVHSYIDQIRSNKHATNRFILPILLDQLSHF